MGHSIERERPEEYSVAAASATAAREGAADQYVATRRSGPAKGAFTRLRSGPV